MKKLVLVAALLAISAVSHSASEADRKNVTESGQSMLKKMPAVLKDSMAMSQKMVQDFLPKMKVLMEEFQKEIETYRKGEQ